MENAQAEMRSAERELARINRAAATAVSRGLDSRPGFYRMLRRSAEAHLRAVQRNTGAKLSAMTRYRAKVAAARAVREERRKKARAAYKRRLAK